jgi:hypothetical protein
VRGNNISCGRKRITFSELLFVSLWLESRFFSTEFWWHLRIP